MTKFNLRAFNIVIFPLCFFLCFFIYCAPQSGGHNDEKSLVVSKALELTDLSKTIWNNLDSYEILNIQEPSHVTHWFLACGIDCTYKKTGQSLLEAWLNFRLSQTEVYYLHRGEFTATLAALGAKLEDKILFADPFFMSVNDFLNIERKYFSLASIKAWNIREEKKGKEFGWSLKSFCHYLGPEGIINENFRVTDIIESMITDGINRSGELGTHELEGLAVCMQAYLDKNTNTKNETYTNLANFLQNELEIAFEKMSVSGNVYSEKSPFGKCQDGNCEIMRDLSAQAHFFEWAFLAPGFSKHPKRHAAMAELESLMHRASKISKDWVKQKPGNANMFLNGATHSIHVTHKWEKMNNKN